MVDHDEKRNRKGFFKVAAAGTALYAMGTGLKNLKQSNTEHDEMVNAVAMKLTSIHRDVLNAINTGEPFKITQTTIDTFQIYQKGLSNLSFDKLDILFKGLESPNPGSPSYRNVKLALERDMKGFSIS